MKTFIVVVGIISAVIVTGTIIYLDRLKTPPPAPIAESSPKPAAAAPAEKMDMAKTASSQTISENTAAPAKTPTAIPAASQNQPADSTNSIAKLVDALLTAKSAGQKHALFQQLRESGQLNAAIAELKQRMTDNPNDPEIPTTLGEAQLNELRAIKESGGDTDQIGILAMQADQNFSAALKIDPQNWEANFVKDSSMYYWPPDAARDSGVVQSLSSLIDQQESLPSQPEFVQTYILLGNEYQKIGQPEKAQATWQMGLAKFPNDPTLRAKINGQ